MKYITDLSIKRSNIFLTYPKSHLSRSTMIPIHPSQFTIILIWNSFEFRSFRFCSYLISNNSENSNYCVTVPLILRNVNATYFINLFTFKPRSKFTEFFMDKRYKHRNRNWRVENVNKINQIILLFFVDNNGQGYHWISFFFLGERFRNFYRIHRNLFHHDTDILFNFFFIRTTVTYDQIVVMWKDKSCPKWTGRFVYYNILNASTSQ